MKWFTDTIQILIDNWPIVLVIVVLGFLASKGSLAKILDTFVEKTGIFGPVGLIALAIAAVVIFKYDAVTDFFKGPGSAVGASGRTEARMFDTAVVPGPQYVDTDGVGPVFGVVIVDPSNETAVNANPVFAAYAEGVKNTYELEAAQIQTQENIEASRQACLAAATATDPSCEAMNRLAEVDAMLKVKIIKAAVDPVVAYIDIPLSYTSTSMSFGLALILGFVAVGIFGRKKTWS